jgi:hypothetical protein
MNPPSVFAAILAFAFVIGGAAEAQKVCEPVQIHFMATFAERAVALDLAQRERFAEVLNTAFRFPLHYVFVEPKAAESEGSKSERELLALRRGQYIRSFLVGAGVPPQSIETALTYALYPMGPPGHIGNRTTSLSIFVIDNEAIRRCLHGK